MCGVVGGGVVGGGVPSAQRQGSDVLVAGAVRHLLRVKKGGAE